MEENLQEKIIKQCVDTELMSVFRQSKHPRDLA